MQLEFWESDVLLGKTELKQGKFVKWISPTKSYLRETYKSQIIYPFSPIPQFTLGIIQIINYFTLLSLININLSVQF